MSNILANMTWHEARDAYADGKVVVVPVGSIEQHGPHMPVGTDFLVADHLGKLLAERCPECIVTPTIPYGFAEYHSDFPGTVSVNNEETLKAYLGEILSHYVRHGVKKILFVNSHGGNFSTLDSLTHHLRKQGVLAATVLWWDIIAAKDPEHSPAGHGDWIETSLVMAINEKLVDMDKAKLPVGKDFDNPNVHIVTPHVMEYDGVGIHIRLRTKDFTDTGDMPEPGLTPQGDATIPPTEASVELGQSLYETVVDYIASFVPEFAKLQLEQ